LRPIRLDLDGFASFRQPTTLDFTDADLFVLSGPTGSGKSSVIDAMTFSLYGIVPRYGDKRLVAPVISNGRNEARVQLHFAVGRERYTAVRVVRRTAAGGATTKEARLERWRGDDPADAAVLAATADEVSTAVEQVLGLGYEHFTTTVVLPQGAFQRFLHAKASERQGLLVELLDLKVFGDIGQAARTRAQTAASQVSVLQSELDGLADRSGDDAVAAVTRRIEVFDHAIVRIDAAGPELDEIMATGRDRAARHSTLATQVQALESVRAPDDLAERTAALATARTAVEEATATRIAARDRRRELDAVVDDLPSPDALEAQAARLERRRRLATEVDEATAGLARARTARTAAEEALATAERAHDESRAHLDHARQADLVATLTADVRSGDPCPVCARPLEDDPDRGDAGLDTAGAAAARAEQAVIAARGALTTATTDASRQEERHAQLSARREEVVAALSDTDLPATDDALAELRARVTAATRDRRTARTAEAEADKALEAAMAAVSTTTSGLEQARTGLDAARDRVAALKPPALSRDDLAGAWEQLVTWRDDQLEPARERVVAAEQATVTARADYTTRLAALRTELADLDHQLDISAVNQAGPLRDAFVQARASASSNLDRLREQRERSEELRGRVTAARKEHAVATELGRLLKRDQFEKWLLARAVNRLVVGASDHLRELTRGAYTLHLQDDGSFGIVDHANGGEVRSARTLSGGETFLASLSLALALSDHVADFAADGAARLESLFIDEGFGTLDAGTVDVVRTALEELGSTGRMVGVVTHVQALAEQLPVQFHVRKESQTSVVERRDV